MHMENFITGMCCALSFGSLQGALGFPGHEWQIREALDEAIGTEDAAFFFDKARLTPRHNLRLTRW